MVMRAAAEWEIESKGSESEGRETLRVQRVQPLSCVHVATRGRVHNSTSQDLGRSLAENSQQKILFTDLL
jgi:hypothetical protein